MFGLAAFLRLAEVGGFKDMHTDIEATPTRTTLSRNAQRQPHAMNCSFVSPHDRSATTPEERHKPVARPICGMLA